MHALECGMSITLVTTKYPLSREQLLRDKLTSYLFCDLPSNGYYFYLSYLQNCTRSCIAQILQIGLDYFVLCIQEELLFEIGRFSVSF